MLRAAASLRTTTRCHHHSSISKNFAKYSTQADSSPLNSSPLISPSELYEHRKMPSLKILDCRPRESILTQGKIPNSTWLPWASSGFKNMSSMLSPEVMAPWISPSLDRQDTMVFYDDCTSLHAARAWWVAQYLGYPPSRMKILNGGFYSWVLDQQAIEKSATVDDNTMIHRKSSSECVSNVNNNVQVFGPEVLSVLKKPLPERKVVFLDSRSDEEYHTIRLPHSINLDWRDTLTPEGKFKSKAELQELVQSKGIKREDDLVTYCQLGVRAAHLAFTLTQILDFPSVRVYEGSMLEIQTMKLPKGILSED